MDLNINININAENKGQQMSINTKENTQSCLILSCVHPNLRSTYYYAIELERETLEAGTMIY
jgi:hypothetical protein